MRIKILDNLEQIIIIVILHQYRVLRCRFMERNGGAGNQWKFTCWCRTNHSDEGEIRSCGVHKYCRIQKVRETGLFTIFTMYWNLLFLERHVFVLETFFLYLTFFLSPEQDRSLQSFQPFFLLVSDY